MSQEHWDQFRKIVEEMGQITPEDNGVQKTALISLSGGMDSTTLAAHVIAKGRHVTAIHFQYKSKHNEQEAKAAALIAWYFKIPLVVVDLSNIFGLVNSTLLASAPASVPTGHYQEESMRQTVVPGRNTIFTSVLMAMAESRGDDEVYLGIHSGDHFIYPDCRPEWYMGMALACQEASNGKTMLMAPYLNGNKSTIIAEGRQLAVPYEYTRTCYTSNVISCGKCGACQERLEAFAANGVEDPIEYQSRELLPKTTTTA